MLWLYLSRQRQGKDGRTILEFQAKAADANKWIGPVCGEVVNERRCRFDINGPRLAPSNAGGVPPLGGLHPQVILAISHAEVKY